MAMKSPKSPTQTVTFGTEKLRQQPPPPLILEPPPETANLKPHKSPKSPVDMAAFKKNLENSPINVPELLKMVTEPLNEYCREPTQSSSSAPKLFISRSEEVSGNSDEEEQLERNFGSISPILQRNSVAANTGSISALGAARANNFRLKFRKSHTCGSLFAKCNCSSPPPVQIQVPITIQAPTNSAIAVPARSRHSTSSTNATTPCSSFHLSISPSDFSTSPTSPSSTGATRNSSSTTSGYHSSLSTQTSSATSANVSFQLSRDESISASFDLGASNTAASTSTSVRNARTSFLLGSTSSNDSTTSCSEQPLIQSTADVQQVSTDTERANLNKKKQLRISTNTAPTPSPTPSRKSETLQKSKRLFHTYSHPDTDFIFTDANKHPSRESLTHTYAVNSGTDAVITSRLSKSEIKHQNRSSSPNIGQFQTLDVAIHPDILVNISPKPSPTLETRRVQSPARTRSAQQRRRLLQRSHEIESGGSTSESEYSVDVKSPVADSAEFVKGLKNLESEKQKGSSHELTSPTLKSKCTSPNDTTEINFNAAQKYFAESGILGPISTSNNLIRKTSKILQDTNVIEQIRKTSMILRANSTTINGNKKTSIATSPTAISTATTTTTVCTVQQNEKTQSSPTTPSKLTLKLRSNNNVNMESPANIIYAPHMQSSPQSPHTLATTCGFSPNLATKSCIITDDRDAQIKSLQGEVVSLKDVIKSRDAEIVKLRREIHKLKSVLQQTTNHLPIVNDDLLQSPTKIPHTQFSPTHIHSQNNLICTCCKQKLNNNDLNTAITTIPSAIPTTTATTISSNNNNATGNHSATDSDSSFSDNYQSCNSLSTYTGTTAVTCALSGVTTDNNKLNINGNTSQTEVGLDVAAMTSLTAATTFAPSLLSCNGVAPKTQQQQIIHQQQQTQQQTTVLKKQGVSGESCETSKQQSINVPIEKFDKDYSSKQLIKEAIMDNDFLKNIDASQVRELVESMYPLSISKGEFVIREGDVGAHLYVSAHGEFEVVKNGKVLGVMGPGKAFGELAILYNCTRTASIRVLCDARVWVLDRRVFQQIMMRTGMQRIENSVNFLKSVPLLKNLSEELLAKIADVLEVEFYPAGTYIIRQGASGDTFFLISQGSVKVTQKLMPTAEEKDIRTLERGDYFGEQALINEDKRTANIIAMAPGVECLTLDRESFTHLIGDLCELKEKNYGDENRVLAMKYAEETREIFGAKIEQEFPDMKLTDLEVVSTLGIGGFGRVELVKAYRENKVDIFALKCLKKRHIVDTKQEEHVFSERTIMMSCKSPFISRLHRTFRDEKYVYMLLEACMGGEIWTMLRDRGSFDENATQFIIGCVLQAFEYLHARGIIYRDLKPENLMLDERGYVKLVDFGFAKYIGNSSKTWTFCGTPEYVAPEIILNKGHDRAVDYWALGVLIHELLNGTPPFTANDPMKTYNIILKGIDMINFPKHMSRSAVMLIKRLCRDVPAERLGYQKGGIQDIKKHKWFLGFDWDGLQSQLLIPPFVRPIAHPTDTSYFDKFPCDPDETPDEFSGWDADF